MIIGAKRRTSLRSSSQRYGHSVYPRLCQWGFAKPSTMQHSKGNKKAEEDAQKDAENKLKEIKSAGSKSGDRVVEDLLKAVTDVKPELPQRVTGSGS